MRILQYKGTSFVSSMIKRFTRSIYSHTAIEFSDGAVFEAWHVGRSGVRFLVDWRDGHKTGTPVDIFQLTVPVNEAEVRRYCESLVARRVRYSWKAIGRFITRRSAPNDDDVICSEVCRDALIHGGVDLFNSEIKSAMVSPAHIGMSAVLKKVGDRA